MAYEGAPVPSGASYRPDGLVEAMRARLAVADPAGALDLFLARVVGMSPEALAAYHAEPVWPSRVAAAHTIVREIEAEGSDAASLDALSRDVQQRARVEIAGTRAHDQTFERREAHARLDGPAVRERRH